MNEGFENFYLYISNTLITVPVNSSSILTKSKDIDISHTIVCDLTGYQIQFFQVPSFSGNHLHTSGKHSKMYYCYKSVNHF